MTVAVLALQGAFAEHEKVLHALGEECFEIRQAADLKKSFDGLILPGGESTVMGKLLHELDLFNPLKERIEAGLPVLATCAGLILLASKLEDDDTVWFGTIPITVRRNAFGRQLGSFHTCLNYGDVGQIPMTFIRAPVITKVSPEVKVLACDGDNIYAVQYKHQTALAFHPELDENMAVHCRFLKQLHA